MQQDKNTKIVWGILGLIIIIGLVFVTTRKDKVADPVDTNTAAVEGTEDTTDPATGKPAVATGTGAVSLSYAQALVKYKDYRIQITNTCQATPNNVTYKNGTSIMIDNRSNQTRTIKLGSTYTIKPYGFRIIKLSTNTFPTTWLMDCDKSQNVATILIQK